MKLNRAALTLGLAAILAVLVLASWAVQRGASGGGKALIGGPFLLVDQDGKAVDEGVLKGKVSAVFFGFTHCPDVCPGTLQALSAAAAQLGPAKSRDLQVLFVSVDPERDTPPVLKLYLDSQRMPVRTLGLTGTPAQIKQIAAAYRVFYEKAPQAGTYTMNHTSTVYLMDKQGRFDRVMAFGMTPAEMADQIDLAL